MQDDAESGVTTEKTDEEMVQILVDLYEEVEPLKIPENWFRQLIDDRARERAEIDSYFAKHSDYPKGPEKFVSQITWEELLSFFKAVTQMEWLHEAVAKAIAHNSEFEDGGGVKMTKEARAKLSSLAQWYPVYLDRPDIYEGGVKRYYGDRYVVGILQFAIVGNVAGEDILTTMNDNVYQRLKHRNLKIRHLGSLQ